MLDGLKNLVIGIGLLACAYLFGLLVLGFAALVSTPGSRSRQMLRWGGRLRRQLEGMGLEADSPGGGLPKRRLVDVLGGLFQRSLSRLRLAAGSGPELEEIEDGDLERWHGQRGPFELEVWIDGRSGVLGRGGVWMTVRSSDLAVRCFQAPTLHDRTWLSPVHTAADLSPRLRAAVDQESTWRWQSAGQGEITATWVGSFERILRHHLTFSQGLEALLGLAELFRADRIQLAPARTAVASPDAARPLDPAAPEWVCPLCGAVGGEGAPCQRCEIPTVPRSSLRAPATRGIGDPNGLRLLTRCSDGEDEEEWLVLLQAHRISAVSFAEPRSICVYHRDLEKARRLLPGLGAPGETGSG